MNSHLAILLVAAMPFSCSQTPSGERERWFDHYTVSTNLSEEPGARFGVPALADFDNDGDLDFSLSETRGSVYWFEYQGNHQWDQHEIGEMPAYQLGGSAFDVDKDGWPDVVAGGYWFRNSQNPKGEAFQRLQYDPEIKHEIHDLVFADIDGDAQDDLVVLGDADGCFWYRVPENPLTDTIWEKTIITLDVLNDRADIHGGFFPGGIGDLDHDGDADIVLVGRWYRNEGQGKSWRKEFLPFGSSGYWGLSGRSWIVDMDGDKDNDIVMIGGDQVDSRCAWLENDGKENPRFRVHLLPLIAEGRRGSFHSLWVSDFDRDDDVDVFTIEQEDHSILPLRAPIRAFLWENLDGQGGKFEEHIVLDKNLGGHDVMFGDADGDGDLDAYFKIWKPYSENFHGGKPHVDFLENVINESRN